MFSSVGKYIDQVMFSDLTMVEDDTRASPGVNSLKRTICLDGRPITRDRIRSDRERFWAGLASLWLTQERTSYTCTIPLPLGGSYRMVRAKVLSRTGKVILAAAALGFGLCAFAAARHCYSEQ